MIIISNSQIEILVSYARSTYVEVKISFLNSNFEGNVSTYVFASHFENIENWKLIIGHRDVHYAKKEIISYVWNLGFL